MIAVSSLARSSGIVATAIFCLIFAWNEYAFAVLLDRTHDDYPDEFWADLADVHEGIAARNESRARLSLVAKPKTAVATKARKR